MKKLFSIGLILSMLFLAMSAQAQVHAGLTGGFNFSDLDMKIMGYENEVTSRTVYGVGGVVDVYLNKTIAVRLEPKYQLRGGVILDDVYLPDDIIDDIPISGVGLTLKSSYIEIPVLLKAEFGKIIKPYIIAGPTIGFLLSSKMEVKAYGMALNVDLKDITEELFFGIGVGFGMSFPFGLGSFFMEGKYTFGLTELQKTGKQIIGIGPIVEDVDIEEGILEYTNKGFEIMVGFTVPLTIP